MCLDRERNMVLFTLMKIVLYTSVIDMYGESGAVYAAHKEEASK